MDGYVKQGKLAEAIKVMDELEDNGVGANEVTYGVMIEAYCKEKKSGEAVNLLNDVVEEREKVWEARKLFDQFETSEPPDVMPYNVLISGMSEVRELCDACQTHFMYANATTSFNQPVSAYPGPLMLVSILCPDPYFKRKHHKRRVVQKPLIDSIVNNLAPRGQSRLLVRWEIKLPKSSTGAEFLDYFHYSPIGAKTADFIVYTFHSNTTQFPPLLHRHPSDPRRAPPPLPEPKLDVALQIFHHASKYHPGFHHNYHNYHAIIRRLLRSRTFHFIDPLLSDLRASDLRCSEDLFISLIRNYGVVSRPKLSFKTFITIPKFSSQLSVRSLNALLNALVHSERFGVAPNVFSCNILIKALCKRNDLETAHQVLDEMPAMGFVPNVVTFTTILGGYVSRRDMVGAKRVFGEILDRGWFPDVTTYTILMDGYVKLVVAIKVMDEMKDNGIGPMRLLMGL
ncbi:pentatricopeptide repeat-containing protein At5g16420, mitochondrial-like [Rosa chinensis]|uniref:pentatricopeptide repeat-containing protein At5g16420, mitochondrial-like n=1 Tax=Rosa chinensis TaxID=74649 RepID=UPI001AD8D97D|nr:pentatricopeptide repeat-containing protein At5g16420, mitochondrial-like [Rosa chinensis]